MSAIHMTYGSYNFEPQPIPLMTISKQYNKTADGLNIGTTIGVSLEGTLIKATGGFPGTLTDTDAEMDVLRTAFNQDGLLFLVFCSGDALVPSSGESQPVQTENERIITSENERDIETQGATAAMEGSFEDVSSIIFSGYPRILNIQFNRSNNNWVQTVPYTIELEFDTTDPTEDAGLMPPYLRDASESWTVEPIDEQFPFTWTLNDGRQDSCPYKVRVSHQVSAVGKAAYNENGLIQQPWEWAKSYVTGLLGYDQNFVSHQGVLTFNPDEFGEFNHNRTTVTSETDGSFSATETWLVVETGIGLSGLPANAIENFNIDINKSIDNGLTSAVINGEIQGLTTANLTGNAIVIEEAAYAAASGYWAEIQNRLLPRIQLVGNDVATRQFNPLVLNSSVGRNPCRGTFSYTFEYNDRPIACIEGAKQEVISISDTRKADVFATLVVLGRLAGPVLQDIGTKTAPTRTLSVDIVMNAATGCPKNGETANWLSQKPTGVNGIVSAVENDLLDNYDQVFKNTDTESWKATVGNYSRTVSWTFLDCS